MESISVKNNDVEGLEKSVSPSPSSQPAGQQHVNSFLKFSIQNILQQAANAANSGHHAAAVAARRSNEEMLLSEIEMKRAIGSLPFW